MIPIALLGLLLPATVHATDVGVRELPCPFGEGNVRVYAKLSSNRLGGWDSDLASYSVGGQWRNYAISTCPSSLYSFPSEGGPSEQLADEEYRTTLHTLLLDAKAEFGEDPAIWERYEIAIRILRLQDEMEPLRVAKLYLDAAWTARDMAVDVYKGLDGPEMAWGLLEAGATELQKTELDDPTKKILHYNLARIAHRGGFLALRDQHINAFEALGNLSAIEQETLSRFRSMTTEVEPLYLAQAARFLEAHLASSRDSSLSSWAHYVLADISRRAGQTNSARTHFTAVTQSDHSEEQLKSLAQWFLERL